MTVETPARGMFAGTDRALFVSVFTRKLRSAGLEVPLSAMNRAGASIELIGPRVHLTDLYWALRLSFVDRREDLELFDRVFDAVFSSEFTPRGENRRPSGASAAGDTEQKLRIASGANVVTGAGLAWSSLPSVVEDDPADANDDDDDGTSLPELAPSDEIALVDRPFDLLDEAELAEAGERLDAPCRTGRLVEADAGDHRRLGQLRICEPRYAGHCGPGESRSRLLALAQDVGPAEWWCWSM